MISAADLAQWNATQVRLQLPRGGGREQLETVAKEFEALFAKQMLDAMRDTLNPDNDLFDGGMAEDIFEDMLYDEYARAMSQAGSLGIADLIVRQYEGTLPTATSSRAANLYDSV